MLSPADGAALDALMGCGFDLNALAKTGADADTLKRAANLTRLFSTLEGPAPRAGDGKDAAVRDAAFTRAMRAGEVGELGGVGSVWPTRWTDLELSPPDKDAVDAWVMGGYDASRVPRSLRPRASKCEELAGLIAGAQANLQERRQMMIDSIMARVEGEAPIPISLARLSERAGGWGWASVRGWRDMVSVAAVLLIAASVIWPVLAGARFQSDRLSCQAGLGMVASAMGQYSGDNRGEMPMSATPFAGGTWWQVGRPQHSNSANLFALSRTGYVQLASLACSGNQSAPRSKPAEAQDWDNLDEVSYSYQVMVGTQRPSWNEARMAVLADRSPVVRRAVAGQTVDPLENSDNHAGRWAGDGRGRGQNVLFNDGSVTWATSPAVTGSGNIWLPDPGERRIEVQASWMSNGVLRITGREVPVRRTDSFLGP